MKFLVDNQLPRALVTLLENLATLLEAFKSALKTIEQELDAGETLIEVY